MWAPDTVFGTEPLHRVTFRLSDRVWKGVARQDRSVAVLPPATQDLFDSSLRWLQEKWLHPSVRHRASCGRARDTRAWLPF